MTHKQVCDIDSIYAELFHIYLPISAHGSVISIDSCKISHCLPISAHGSVI